jgi:hypothetical protein
MPERTAVEGQDPAPATEGPNIPPLLTAVFGLPILVVFLWFILPLWRSRRTEPGPSPEEAPAPLGEDEEPPGPSSVSPP